MVSPEEAVQRYALCNYGNLILFDSPVFNGEEKL
jgi:hypothetical protein